LPKSKPTQVIVHRIEFQEKEREMLEALVVGKTLKNLVEPVAAVGAVYVTYKAAKAAGSWIEDTVPEVEKDLKWAWKGVVRVLTWGTREELFPS